MTLCNLCEDQEAIGKCYSCTDFFCGDCMHDVKGLKVCIDCEESIKGKEMKIKIFEGGILRECLKRCLDEGYLPANSEQIYDLVVKNKIPNQWYNTRTYLIKGKFRTATLNELKNIDETYKKGCLLGVYRVGGGSRSDADGDDDLDFGGRLVGLMLEAHKKKVKKNDKNI